jgi:hypothetical protein
MSTGPIPNSPEKTAFPAGFRNHPLKAPEMPFKALKPPNPWKGIPSWPIVALSGLQEVTAATGERGSRRRRFPADIPEPLPIRA